MLERDLDEASTRLNLAHKEIRRLTDQLESAHLTKNTYGKNFRNILVCLCVFLNYIYSEKNCFSLSESELHGAQVEAEQLRHEVEKLKHCGNTRSSHSYIVLLWFIQT